MKVITGTIDHLLPFFGQTLNVIMIKIFGLGGKRNFPLLIQFILVEGLVSQGLDQGLENMTVVERKS